MLEDTEFINTWWETLARRGAEKKGQGKVKLSAPTLAKLLCDKAFLLWNFWLLCRFVTRISRRRSILLKFKSSLSTYSILDKACCSEVWIWSFIIICTREWALGQIRAVVSNSSYEESLLEQSEHPTHFFHLSGCLGEVRTDELQVWF